MEPTQTFAKLVFKVHTNIIKNRGHLWHNLKEFKYTASKYYVNTMFPNHIRTLMPATLKCEIFVITDKPKSHFTRNFSPVVRLEPLPDEN